MDALCAFVGHEPARFKFKYKENNALCRKIKAALRENIAGQYAQGVRQFCFGGGLGVDLWAAEAVLQFQKEHPDVQLRYTIPFEGHDDKWDSVSRRRLQGILAQCQAGTVARPRPTADAYKARGYQMVDQATTLIAVYDNDRSVRCTTGVIVNYAQKKGVPILYIHPDTAQIVADGSTTQTRQGVM